MSAAAYRESGTEWIGRIPRYWELKPAFSVLQELDESNDRGQVQNVLSLSYGKIIRRDVESNFGLLPESFNTYQIVRNGDIVLRLLDLQNDHVSLRVGLVPEEGIVTSAYVAVRPKKGLDSRYAAYLLHAYDLKKVFYNFGGGCRQSMGFEDLRRLPVPFPSPADQRRIAAYLDEATGKIDRLMGLRRRQMDLLREQRAALIQQAVTRGLNPRAPLKDSGLPWLGRIPEHWVVAPLNFRYEVQLGKMLDGSKIKGDALAPYLRNTDVQWDSINTSDLPLMDFSPRDRAKFSLRSGDLLVCEGGEVGRAAIWNEQLPNCYYQKALHRLRPRNAKDNPRYMLHTLCIASSRGLFSSEGGQTTIDHLPAEALRRFRFPFAPRNEQDEIVSFIERETAKLDELHRSYERQLALLAEYRASLIHECVTGQRAVGEKS